MTQYGVVVAIVTSSVAVVVAVLTQVSIWTLDRRNRTAERRRAALLELQDAALAVRGRLGDYAAALLAAVGDIPGGALVVVPEDRRLSAARSDADAVLTVHLARIEDGPVEAAARDWSSKARMSFLGDDDVTDHDEVAAWTAFNDAVARSLRALR